MNEKIKVQIGEILDCMHILTLNNAAITDNEAETLHTLAQTIEKLCEI